MEKGVRCACKYFPTTCIGLSAYKWQDVSAYRIQMCAKDEFPVAFLLDLV
ncbi:hypothetical protein CBFG_00123 [Clostridiales bacterium 1_7_47FAA]|nr:hypothetical protein CBFG_00123 [Clostridiales bacterium 1_7_47FAA]